jgi:hypothetical protein
MVPMTECFEVKEGKTVRKLDMGEIMDRFEDYIGKGTALPVLWCQPSADDFVLFVECVW